jgi:hypothetical protein
VDSVGDKYGVMRECRALVALRQIDKLSPNRYATIQPVDSWRPICHELCLRIVALRGVRSKITQVLRYYTVRPGVSPFKPIREYLTYGRTLLAASQSSVKSRNAVRFARISRLIERDLAHRWANLGRASAFVDVPVT